MSPSYYTYSALIGIISSLFLGFFISLEFLQYFVIFLFLIGVIGILNQYISFFYQKINPHYGYVCIVFSLFFLLGILRLQSTFAEKPNNHIIYFLNQKVSLEAKIVAEIDEREEKIKYTVEISKINDRKAQGKLLINASKFPPFEYGDILKIKGIMKEAPEDENFSYKKYLSRYEIYAIMDFAQIQKIDNDPNSILFKYIFDYKKKFLEKINRTYSEPYASFLSGLLIGARKGLPEQVQEDFRISGLSHIVAVSGSNITMIMALVMTLLMFLPRMISFAVSVVFVILFTIFVGMSAAVVRAAIMGIIGLVAIQAGRPKATLIALLTTIAVMGLWQPKMLIWDIGFQLSVSAVIGVIWLVPIMPKFFHKLPEKFAIKEAIVLTIAAQITTLPISVMNFHAFSLVAPLANLFVVPAIPFAMLFGFISMFPIPMLSDLSGFIAYLLLKISLFFAHFFASIPYAQIENIWINNWWWILFIGILGILFWKYYKKEK
jgi:competence protein ComEC